MTTGLPAAPIPEFLAATFAPGALDRIGTTIAALDPRGNILWVNAAWYQHARDHGSDEFVLARYPSYLDGIAGPLRAEYEQVLAQVVATGEVFEQDYECSSPDAIRIYRMRILPFLPGGLLVEHTQVAAREAPPGEPPVEEQYVNEHGMITQCSNCRRVRRANAGEVESWAWVPHWVAHSHPRTSHGLCTPCYAYYWRRKMRPKR